jgi:hypothetical protein
LNVFSPLNENLAYNFSTNVYQKYSIVINSTERFKSAIKIKNISAHTQKNFFGIHLRQMIFIYDRNFPKSANSSAEKWTKFAQFGRNLPEIFEGEPQLRGFARFARKNIYCVDEFFDLFPADDLFI